jgi:hypothetical protein
MPMTEPDMEKLTIPMSPSDLQAIRVKAAKQGISMAEYGRRKLGIGSEDVTSHAAQQKANKEQPAMQTASR